MVAASAVPVSLEFKFEIFLIAIILILVCLLGNE